MNILLLKRFFGGYFKKDNFLQKEQTLCYFYKFLKNEFIINNIPEPVASTENILAHVIGTNKISDVRRNLGLKLNKDQIQNIEELCKLRLKRMPVQYVIGEWNFRELILKMKPPVFIPRPETEMLIDIILNDLNTIDDNKQLNMLEICCGSGAISLALLKSKQNLRVTAVDQSLEACQLTLENADRYQLTHRLKVQQSQISNENQLQDICAQFDVIVSNPPYVPSAQVLTVEAEIKLYEDLSALDGGQDGLSVIKPILSIAADKLCPGGKLYLETDPTHPSLIETIIKNQPKLKLQFFETYLDFCRKKRFVKIEKKMK